MPTCDVCDFNASKFEDYRFRVGNFTVHKGGEVIEANTLCEECYNAYIK